MKTIIAKYNNEDIYIHYVSSFLEYAIVSRDPEPVKQFKVSTSELTGVTEEELMKIVRDRILQEQTKGTH